MDKKTQMAVVILAAGLGTRMKSDRAKVLHEIGGKSMLHYVLESALDVTVSDNIVVVVGCQAEAVQAEAARLGNFRFAYQAEQLGTGHAVLCALEKVPASARRVVILCGDVPFLSSRTIQGLIDQQQERQADVSLLSVRHDHPTGYGRLVINESGQVIRIVEEADADEEEKKITIVNAGTYCVEKSFLAWALDRLETGNAQNELYLTDIVDIAYRSRRGVTTLTIDDAFEVIGINSVADLNAAEEAARQKSGLLS
ncbi:MAG: NTP transferase domain-containing protein [Desulfosudaceae bacterium]